MRSITLGIAAGLVCLAPALAHAQPGGDIDLQSFRPAMDSRGYITVDASQVLGHRELSFGLVTTWGSRTLSFEDGDARYAVDNLVTPTLVGAFGLRLGELGVELGVSVPFTVMNGDRGPDDDGGTPGNPNDDENFRFEGQGLGDLGVHAKVRILPESKAPVGLAVVGSVQLPTASSSGRWLGGGGVAPRLSLVVDKEIGRLSLAANAGFRYRERTRFVDAPDMDDPDLPVTMGAVEVGSTIPFGAGIAYQISKQKVSAVAEIFGEVPLTGEGYFPLEAVAGLKLYLAKNSFLTFGGGAGLLRGEGGTPDARAFLGIVFEPNVGDRDGDGLKDDVDACPDDPEDYDDFEDADGCPELDNDLDRIPDVDDGCPNEPEDRDGDEDGDGCPEGTPMDRDNDQIVDREDECPDDPEDYDGFADGDGCPDPDNDEDGVLDVDDLCPDDPEDHDGWEDDEGCPDPDNDRDRILDTDDECKNEPETYNTVDDEDGCPDHGPVSFTDTEMVVLKKIYFEFDSAKIKKRSHKILRVIAKTMELNPKFQLIEVQGHTDERGSDEYNLKLSQARAEAVVRFLEDEGVAPERLEAQGYGERVPLIEESNQQAWAKNRRVQFIILKRAGD